MAEYVDDFKCTCRTLNKDCRECGAAWLREKFFEYREGNLSERNFRLVLSQYSKLLRSAQMRDARLMRDVILGRKKPSELRQ